MFHPKRLYTVRSVGKTVKKQGRSPLFLLCICFLLGTLLGSVFAAIGGSHPQLAERLTDFFQSAVQSGLPDVSIWRIIWEAICWPVLLILLSFGPLGLIGIPCTFLVRGFLLGYACAGFVAMFGVIGLAWNIAVFGASALLLLPVFLRVGHWAFSFTCKKNLHLDIPSSSQLSTSSLFSFGALVVLFIFLQSKILPLYLPKLCERLLSL